MICPVDPEHEINRVSTVVDLCTHRTKEGTIRKEPGRSLWPGSRPLPEFWAALALVAAGFWIAADGFPSLVVDYPDLRKVVQLGHVAWPYLTGGLLLGAAIAWGFLPGWRKRSHAFDNGFYCHDCKKVRFPSRMES